MLEQDVDTPKATDAYVVAFGSFALVRLGKPQHGVYQVDDWPPKVSPTYFGTYSVVDPGKRHLALVH